VAIVELGWAERTSLADRTAQVSDVAPASKSCGDFQLRGTWGSIPIKVEVVEGNIPCRVAQRVMRDEYRGVPTALWSCGGWRTGITTCEKNRHGTIRGRL
jgi:hypothetical protein